MKWAEKGTYYSVKLESNPTRDAVSLYHLVDFDFPVSDPTGLIGSAADSQSLDLALFQVGVSLTLHKLSDGFKRLTIGRNLQDALGESAVRFAFSAGSSLDRTDLAGYVENDMKRVAGSN